MQRSIEKLESLYHEWKTIQKTSKRRNETQIKQEQAFLEKLDDLFDVAHANALESINIEEDKIFLLNQRKKGRPGSIIGGDYVLSAKENKLEVRKNLQETRIAKSQRDIQRLEKSVELQSSSSSSLPSIFNEEEKQLSSDADEINIVSENVSNLDENINRPSTSDETHRKQSRARTQVLTPKLVTILDKCKVSDRDAVQIIIATAQALGHDVNDLVINRTSIRHYRSQMRKKIAEELCSTFKKSELDSVTVHWDGKMLSALVGKEQVDRLAVLISYKGIEKLLGIPVICSSSGNDQANAVYELLNEWKLLDKVQALSFDTTASNTGRFQGACILLEQKIGRDLLYVPCRHHIYEIILRSVFDEKISASSGPNIPQFKQFQQAWPLINKSKFKPGIEDKQVRRLVKESTATEMLQFMLTTLENEQQSREDYRELLELVIIFLGGTPPRGISFRAPGAFHHARWMSKAIYSLKIFLFRDEFNITAKEKVGFRNICVFLVTLYVKAWNQAPIATKAPSQDLQFLKDLYEYRKIDKDISHVTLHKFCNHLWYLVPETAALAFFDEHITIETKRLMVESLKFNDSTDESMKKLIINPKNITNYLNYGIQQFISQQSKHFFERFSIPMDFIEKDPTTWASEDSFKIGMEIVKTFKVVNDTAERGIKLMHDYNQVLSKNEEEKQFILQIISQYKTQYPNVKKSTLIKDL